MVGGSQHHARHAHPTVSTERTARSTVPSGSRINPKATAIAVRRGSNGTMVGPTAEPHLCLYREPQTLRCVFAKSPMHQAARFAFLPSTWTNPPGSAHGSWRTRQSLPRHSGKERRWTLSCANSRIRLDCVASDCAEITVCAGAVLPGGSCPESQATRSLPQPTDNTHCGSRLLAEVRGELDGSDNRSRKTFRSRSGRRPHGTSRNFRHESTRTGRPRRHLQSNQAVGRRAKAQATHGPCGRLRGVTLRHSTDESFEQRRSLVGGHCGDCGLA